jgi:Tol biopolymer transport system component
VAEISHRGGWGIVPSLSPDGRLLAYTSYPDGAIDPASQSELYVLDLESGGSDLVAEGVDLRLPPLWSPDGSLLLVRRTTEAEVMILQVDLDEADEDDRVAILLQAELTDVLTFVPVGFAEGGGSFYIAQVQGGSVGGTLLGVHDLGSVPPTGPASQPTPVVRLSENGIARDYDLSPDSGRLVFLAQELVEGRLRFRAFIADLAAGSVTPLSTDGLGDGDHLRPLWHPDGGRLALGQPSTTGRTAAVALVSLDGDAPSFLLHPDVGFDVPLSWAPDGSYLAVISLDGDNLARRLLALVSPAGQRIALGDGVDAVALGWVQR